MRNAKPILFIGLLASIAIVGYLMIERGKATQQSVDAIGVAAGNTDDDGMDLTSSRPLSKCYPVAGPNALDIQTRMDFEARTTKGWVRADRLADGPDQFCIEESPHAVADRLAEQRQ